MKNENLTIENKFTLALENHQKKNLTIAEKLYKEVLETRPNHLEAICYLGTLFVQAKKISLAKPLFLKAVEINPNNPNINNNLGNIFFELGEIQKSSKYFEKAIQLQPNHADAYYNLGIIFNSLKKYQKAVNCFEKVIQIQPDNIKCYNNLSSIFQDLGEYTKAISYYQKAIKIDSSNTTTINDLVELFRSIQLSNLTETNSSSIKELFLFLFRKNNINHQNIASNAKLLLFSDNEQNQLLGAINSDSLLTNKILQSLIKEELFHLMLQKSLITDKFLEKLLTKLRYEMLFILDNSNKDNLKEHFNFIISLAEQSWFNEYVYIQSEKEINKINKLKYKIENNDKINESEIAILGTYIPLNSSEIIINKLLDYKSSNILFDDLINIQIKEPLKELELVKSITSLDVIDDAVSKKVREQYEENPYPRWRFTYKYLSKNFFVVLNEDIKPNQIDHNNKFNNSNVLIAGCGTGSHSINAIKYKNTNILAVDLSLTSLAYAKRKTEKLGYKNIKYLHADILQLNKLNRKFDIIECAGTLHHMKDPIKGLKVLLDILEPHGFLRIGLYSETGRQHVVKARELIKKRNFRNTNENIKNFRQEIINDIEDQSFKLITQSQDFYSTSSVRDFLFHVQEHRFTIPQISKILKDLDLEFLGFFFDDEHIKRKFSKFFPNDKENISLDNWHQFEINNPNIFSSMYQFWVKKK